MTASEQGVERTAFHSTLQACQGGAPMSPVCATGELEDPGLIVTGRTSYLALLQLGHLPDGQILAPAVSGDGTVMVHAVAGDDGTLALMIVDMRDPASADGAAPVEISAPTDLPSDAPEAWELTEGSKLTGEALDAQESTLTAPAELSGEFDGATLDRDDPVMLTSDPGSVTLLSFDPAEETEPSDGGQ